MTRQRKRLTPEQKAVIVRRHLVDGAPVADLAEEHGIAPNQFYRWQQQVFSNLPALFERKSDSPQRRLKEENERLRQTIARKDEVIAEVTEELIAAKEKTGGRS